MLEFYSGATGLSGRFTEGFSLRRLHFVEQFQTSGFDARIFELYLHAYFESSGYVISRTRSNPDFILTRQRATVAVEATTSNPSGGAQSLQNFGKQPNRAGIT